MYTAFMQIFFIFIATIGFSIIFMVDKKELLYCGITGVICFSLYYVFCLIDQDFVGVIVGCFVSTCISRTFTYYRKMPTTIYIIPSIIPLAPGGALYSAMYNLINNDYQMALSYGLSAIKISGAIAIGISISLSLPWFFFPPRRKSKKSNS